MWQLPGGSMRDAETPETAALRELAEESGYSAKRTKILGSFFTHNRLSDQRQYVIVCRQLYAFNLPSDADEFIETYWKSRPELKKMIANQEIDNINMLAALNLWFHSS